MIDPVEIIKRDHRKVERLFKEYEDSDENAFDTKSQIVERIAQELKVHTEMEEVILYPRAEEVFNNKDDKMVEEAYAEHEVIKRILEELSVTHPEDPQFDARVKVLNENVAHHVMEEEQELLPRIEKELGEEGLNSMGEDMQTFQLENGTEESK
jgi:hemerythrin-like domain-containing protein